MINKLSTRWSEQIKDLVNNSKLNLLRVYDNTFVDSETTTILNLHNLNEVCHCDFCGQRIKYVSVLEFDKSKQIYHFQIGKECMSYLFEYGMKINGLDQAKYMIESSVKKLMKASSERARAEKYKSEFDKYFKWLESLDPMFIEKNGFLKFINSRLRTGNGIVTMKMMKVLDDMIVKFNAKNTKDIREKEVLLLEKIDTLLRDIENAYGNTNTKTYNFVFSVRQFVSRNGMASKKQLEALNSVYKQVKEVLNKNKMTVTEEIPW